MIIFPINRPGDLDTAIEQVRRRRRYLPVAGSDMGGFWEKIKRRAFVQRLLTFSPLCQQVLSCGTELPLKIGYEL